MELQSARAGMMKSYLPPLYEKSRVMHALWDAEGQEFDALREAIWSTLDQTFVRTATWGLDRWEQELGLPPATGQSDQERQDRIVSRLRGIGTATIKVVKHVAAAYENGAIDVIEDFPAHTITIRFVDTRGIPSNLADLQAALRAVVPAHLAITYEFRYLTWNELDSFTWDWDTLDALGLTWDELEVYKP